MGMANTFGARLVLARNEKGLGQMTLAERVGMAQTQLSRYETDKVRPRLRGCRCCPGRRGQRSGRAARVQRCPGLPARSRSRVDRPANHGMPARAAMTKLLGFFLWSAISAAGIAAAVAISGAPLF